MGIIRAGNRHIQNLIWVIIIGRHSNNYLPRCLTFSPSTRSTGTTRCLRIHLIVRSNRAFFEIYLTPDSNSRANLCFSTRNTLGGSSLCTSFCTNLIVYFFWFWGFIVSGAIDHPVYPPTKNASGTVNHLLSKKIVLQAILCLLRVDFIGHPALFGKFSSSFRRGARPIGLIINRKLDTATISGTDSNLVPTLVGYPVVPIGQFFRNNTLIDLNVNYHTKAGIEILRMLMGGTRISRLMLILFGFIISATALHLPSPNGFTDLGENAA